jgi:glycerophosphoryl diester phosphodiesterase
MAGKIFHLHMRLLLFLVLIATSLMAFQNDPCIPASLQDYFAWKPDRKAPIFMAHRMAPPAEGYAENSLRAMERCFTKYQCVVQEIDVRMTSDSVLVLLHDDSLERTTTGKGKLNQQNWHYVQQLQLKDTRGNVLHHETVPLFDDILKLAKGKVLLALDMKPGTDPLRMMKAVESQQMIGQVFVICYTLAEAQMLYAKYPSLMLALGFNTPEQIAAIKTSGIPFQNIIALTTREILPAEYYKGIHDMGITTSFSAFGGLDTLKGQSFAVAAATVLDRANGIICTDSLDKWSAPHQ